MIQPAFRTPLMPAVGIAALLETRGGTADTAAIALSPITMSADPEHRMTFPAAANPLTQNEFAMNRHARRRRALDNGSRSWQVRTSFDAS